MNIRTASSVLLAALALAATAASAHASTSSIVLQDDFSGGSFDSAKWTVFAPDFWSDAFISDGKAKLWSRATLATAFDIGAPITVGGTFTSGNSAELFSVTLRSNLELSSFSGRKGVSVVFSDVDNRLEVVEIDESGNGTMIGNTPYSFTTGVAYDFEISDNGTDIAVSINGSLVGSASSSLNLGSRIAFYSREWSSTYSTLDNVVITGTASAIPEPSAFAALAGFSVLGLAAGRRRRRA